MPSSHLILCRPLFLLPPIPPSIRVFSNESILRMTWPKYWTFIFSIIPSKEIAGLISFRMDWLDLMQSKGLSRVFSNTTVQKHQFLSTQPSSQSNSHIMTTGNDMDLTEAEDIKKRWQEYTAELYKRDLHDPYNHDGVITHLEPDILECEVKWALESITMNKTLSL